MATSQAFRITMIWQGIATAAVGGLAGFFSGSAGLVSALLGGGIGLMGVWVFSWMAQRRIVGSGSVVRVALRAEAAKVIAIVVMLWLVFAIYRDVVVLAFFGAFMVSVLLSGIAFAVTGD